MSKVIKSRDFDTKPFKIRKTDRFVKFYDYYTYRTYTRKAWADCIGGIYVWLNGRFVSLSIMSMTESGLPFTINEYVAC